MTSSSYTLEVDLGESNGKKIFTDTQSLGKFLKHERDFWQWLSESPVKGQFGNNPWSQIEKKFNQLAQRLIGKDLELINIENDIHTTFRALFINWRLPMSETKVAIFIEKLRQEDPVSAAAALITWMDSGTATIDINKFEHVKGAMLMVAFDDGITKRTPETVRRSLKEIESNYRDSIEHTKVVASEIADKYRKESQEFKEISSAVINGEREKAQQQRELLEAKVNLAITELKETEQLYKEQMKIKAPVEYWSNKAKDHEGNAKFYSIVLILFSIAAGGLLILALATLADNAIEIAREDKPTAIYLILSTIGVVLTTIVFWAARIFTRLFLSQHHLAIDSRERAVMAQTYLALTAENSATDDDRAIVLSSLFRPTADGIVKDDAAPELSPAVILSRFKPQ